MKNFTMAAVVALTCATASYASNGHKAHANNAERVQSVFYKEADSRCSGIDSVVKDLNCESVANDGAVTLYVNNFGKSVDQPLTTAQLTPLPGTKIQNVTLAATGTAMRAKGTSKLLHSTKPVVWVPLTPSPASILRFALS